MTATIPPSQARTISSGDDVGQPLRLGEQDFVATGQPAHSVHVGPPVGDHLGDPGEGRTVEIRVLGTSGRPRVDIDGFFAGS